MWDNNGTDICYSYDKNGNIIRETEQLDGFVSRNVIFEYDRYGRVEAFTDANGHKETYLYESGFGNRMYLLQQQGVCIDII